MLRLSLLAVGAAGLLSTAAMAQVFDPSSRPTEAPEPSAPSSTATAQDSADPDKVVCRSVRPPTGTRVKSSRTRTKICMTKGEWDEQARQAQESMKEKDRGVCPMGGTCRG